MIEPNRRIYPVRDDGYYVNNEKPLKLFNKRLNSDHGFCFVGGSGMGKTSILLKIQRDLLARCQPNEQHYIPVYFDASQGSVNSLTDFHNRLCDSIVKDVDNWLKQTNLNEVWHKPESLWPNKDNRFLLDIDIHEFSNRLAKNCQLTSSPIIVLMVDRLYAAPASLGQNFFQSCLSFLCDFSNDNYVEYSKDKLKLILTMEERPSDHFIKESSDYLSDHASVFFPIYLEPFDSQDIQRFVNTRLKYHDSNLEIDQGASLEIFRFAGGHLRILSEITEEIRNELAEGATVNADYVKKHTDIWAKIFTDLVYKLQTEISKNEVLAMCMAIFSIYEEGISKPELIRILQKQHGLKDTPSYEPAIDHLMSLGVIRKSSDLDGCHECLELNGKVFWSLSAGLAEIIEQNSFNSFRKLPFADSYQNKPLANLESIDNKELIDLKLAVCDAYHTYGQLRQAIMTNSNLNDLRAQMFTEGNHDECVFNLLMIAKRLGKVTELVQTLHTENRGNLMLRDFIAIYADYLLQNDLF